MVSSRDVSALASAVICLPLHPAPSRPSLPGLNHERGRKIIRLPRDYLASSGQYVALLRMPFPFSEGTSGCRVSGCSTVCLGSLGGSWISDQAPPFVPLAQGLCHDLADVQGRWMVDTAVTLR